MKNHNFDPAALGSALEALTITSRDRLVVGYSGGCDSTVLLHALAALRWPAVRAVHVNHGLQAAASAWARQAQDQCQRLGLSCDVRIAKVMNDAASGLEAAARAARYAAFCSALSDGEVLVLAHHADDQAETVLLQLLRGTGLDGLAGMPAIGPLGRGRLVRPLLDVPRSALHAYAKREGLRWIDDPSNNDLRLRRNFLRAHIMPVLSEAWPALAAVISRNARHMRETRDLLASYATRDLAECRGEDGELLIDCWSGWELPRRRLVLRAWIGACGARAPSLRALSTLERALLEMPASRAQIITFQGGTVRRYRQTAWWGPVPPRPPASATQFWRPPEPLVWAAAGFVLSADPAVGAGFAVERLQGALRVALRHNGEQVLVPGQGHRALKKLMRELRIPPWERGRAVLFFDAEALVGISGFWICPAYRARADEAGWVPRVDAIAD
ncbi:MAG: tRNA lysidine(34) synthetase TilS [Acidiferrobacter sp.]